MTISFSCEDYDDCEWWYAPADDFAPLKTKRSRRCCSCKEQIKPGEDALRFGRWRSPNDRCNYTEEAIYGDEVPLADWYMCEKCGGLYMAVTELGMCCDIDEDMAMQIKDHNYWR